LKAKLTAKEAEKARRLAEGEDDDSDYESDKVLDHREKARQDKEREVNADLSNAADLFGAAAHGGNTHPQIIFCYVDGNDVSAQSSFR
jgi:translation initiation factor 3 subunit J